MVVKRPPSKPKSKSKPILITKQTKAHRSKYHPVARRQTNARPQTNRGQRSEEKILEENRLPSLPSLRTSQVKLNTAATLPNNGGPVINNIRSAWKSIKNNEIMAIFNKDSVNLTNLPFRLGRPLTVYEISAKPIGKSAIEFDEDELCDLGNDIDSLVDLEQLRDEQTDDVLETDLNDNLWFSPRESHTPEVDRPQVNESPPNQNYSESLPNENYSESNRRRRYNHVILDSEWSPQITGSLALDSRLDEHKGVNELNAVGFESGLSLIERVRRKQCGFAPDVSVEPLSSAEWGEPLSVGGGRSNSLNKMNIEIFGNNEFRPLQVCGDSGIYLFGSAIS